MNIKQPDTLFQTMEKWLIAYQAKHNCTEDVALDKFDEMSDTIRATGKGETATEFHNSVKASLEEITPRKSVTCQVIPDDHIFDDSGTKAEIIISGRRACDTEASRTQVEYTTTTGKVVKSSVTPVPLPAHVGGPLLETGVDPLSFGERFPGIVEATVNGQRYQDMVAAKSNTMKPVSHEEVIQIEIDHLNKMIVQYDQLAESAKTQSAHKLYLLHTGRVEMLEGLKSRQQVRTGRVLSLKGKN